MILNLPQNGSSKDILTLLLTNHQQKKRKLTISNIDQNLSSTWQGFTIWQPNPTAGDFRVLFKLPIRGYVQSDDGYLQAPIFAAALDWERIQGRVFLHEIYIAYTLEKLILKTPNLTGIF